jgi:hypothetical protein
LHEGTTPVEEARGGGTRDAKMDVFPQGDIIGVYRVEQAVTLYNKMQLTWWKIFFKEWYLDRASETCSLLPEYYPLDRPVSPTQKI